MRNYLEEIEIIEKEINDYYENYLEETDEEEDYKKNKFIKEKIKHLIIDLNNSDSALINKALIVLAKSTGCAEDQEIADGIINYLHNNKYIDDEKLNYFYDNTATRRWE